jgi:aminopeptidase N
MRIFLFLLIGCWSYAQQSTKVDFKTLDARLHIDAKDHKVSGEMKYVFEINTPIDTIKIDAQKMIFKEVKINDKSVRFVNLGKSLKLFEGFDLGANVLTFTYEATPKQTLYFNGDFSSSVVSNQQIWTQGQGKYTSHWLPSFDDVNEKVIFNISFSFDKRFQVISNGILKKEIRKGNEMEWQYSMKKPMSSYLVMVAIGDFRNTIQSSKSGVPLQYFIQPKDTAKFEATYRYSKRIFDYLEKEIGVKYPWKVYKQIPVEDFLYAGMENTSATLFSEDFVVDEIGFNDRNYINVNAHELAHQWFGDLVTAQSGTHHWLQEGFATYYALLAEKEIFGEDYFYHQLYRTSLQLRNASKTDTIPVLNEKASSLSYYQKGAWALHVLRESIGSKAFKKVVKTYLKKYQFQNVTTDDFLTEVKKVAPEFDTDAFKKRWLLDYHFQTEEANLVLRKNPFLQRLFEVQQLRKNSFEVNKEQFKVLLHSPLYYPIKTEILYQIKDLPFEDKKEFLLLALESKDVKVRQAVAEFTDEIPIEFKAYYETLLDDASYDTKEIALIRLFNSFPESQLDYIHKANDWRGNNDLGLRTTMLFLCQKAIGLDPNLSLKYKNELFDYTSSKYESSIRQNALQSAVQLTPIDDQVLLNLVQATTHFKWQFSKFAKEYIRQLMTLESYKERFQNFLPSLPLAEQQQLDKLLHEKRE